MDLSLHLQQVNEPFTVTEQNCVLYAVMLNATPGTEKMPRKDSHYEQGLIFYKKRVGVILVHKETHYHRIWTTKVNR